MKAVLKVEMSDLQSAIPKVSLWAEKKGWLLATLSDQWMAIQWACHLALRIVMGQRWVDL